MNRSALAGVVALLLAAAVEFFYTRPARAEAQALMDRYARERRIVHDLRTGASDGRARATLWAQAVATTSAASSGARTPVLALRTRLLAALQKAQIRDVTLEVREAKAPRGASAHVAGETDYEHVVAFLDTLDPRREGYVPNAVRLDAKDDSSRVGFSVEIETPR